MPPKPKHTREEIIAAGVELVREKGMDALSSRELGVKLGTTARPIFTAFESMEELQREVRLEILHRFDEYGKSFSDGEPAFERIGMMVISFAMDEPNFFKMLFMKENTDLHYLERHLKNMRNIVDICFADISREYNLTEQQTRFLFDQFWIYTYGISAMCEMKICRYEKQEIIDRLNYQVNATLKLIKSKEK